ncbi:hypothetical protein [Mucilaginibacter sp. OK098]|uniref:hypothetical protein n=1 Tax=Mucilaginibacter sp. OK098 TaxID=1855297 RepID=UPI0009227D41|nr:hypothetical protein [Mucilaginibacter sp. OK098]SHM82895.1 hypothetical protein SAMN05216524_103579 [Mucilaginibacter sp. OK098]
MAVFVNQLKKYFSFDWVFSESDYTEKRESVPCSLFLENRENYTGFYIDIGTLHPYPFLRNIKLTLLVLLRSKVMKRWVIMKLFL